MWFRFRAPLRCSSRFVRHRGDGRHVLRSRVEVSPATVTGFLTILGYSLYDTVVVFDKVRERPRIYDQKHYTFAESTSTSREPDDGSLHQHLGCGASPRRCDHLSSVWPWGRYAGYLAGAVHRHDRPGTYSSIFIAPRSSSPSRSVRAPPASTTRRSRTSANAPPRHRRGPRPRRRQVAD